MFQPSTQPFSTSRSALIPWLVAGLMVLALAPATAGAMPGRESQAQPVTQDLRSPDQVTSGAAVAPLDLRAPDQVYSTPSGHLPMSHATPSVSAEPASSGNGIDTWIILAFGGALLAACAAGIGAARRTRVRPVGHP
jgi:hypothetical protein